MPAPDAKPSDTSFRRTWDRAEYAAKASERDTLIKEEGKARAEAKAEGKKYHRPLHHRASTPPDAKASTHRTSRLDVSANVGKTMLVPAGAGVGKRGRSAGFYCADCDLTFKDNLQLVEHENSRQHQVNTGQSGEVRKAGLEEVRERLSWLARRRREEVEEREKGMGGLRERLEGAVRDEEEEREAKRAKRREKRRKGNGGVKQEVDEEGYGGGIIC